MLQETKIIKFTPKQAEAKRIADNNIITLYGGAIRGGKTWWLILMIWILAKKYPKSRWLILRNSVPTLVKTTLVTFQNLLDNGLYIDVADWSQQNRMATLYNGSQVFFMAESYDTDKELNRFRGLEINGAAIDEINEIQEVTFNKVIERSGSWQHSPGCPIKILSSCNPTKNWVKTRFYDRWKQGTLPKNWAYIPAKITDNPHISKEYMESLKELPPLEYQMFVDGDWEVQARTGGEFYKCFSYEEHTRELTYSPDLPLHISFDFNLHPYMTLTVYQIEGKKIYQIDEFCFESPYNRTENVCAAFKEKYKSHEAGLFIYGDPNGKQEMTSKEEGFNDYAVIHNALSSFRPSFRMWDAAPRVAMRGKFINEIFRNNYEGIAIWIGRNCKKSVDDFLYTKEAHEGGKYKKERETNPITGVSYEKYGHTSDSFDYFICKAFENEYNKYKAGGQIITAPLIGKRIKNSKYTY